MTKEINLKRNRELKEMQKLLELLLHRQIDEKLT